MPGGAPSNNKNATNAAQAKQALKAALEKRQEKGASKTQIYKALVEIWEKQIELALQGEIDSAKFIVERLDGKPVQQVEMKVDPLDEYSDEQLYGMSKHLSNLVNDEATSSTAASNNSTRATEKTTLQ